MELNGHQRARRKDIVAYQNGELSTSSSSDDDYDPWTAWAYKPWTITLLLIGESLALKHLVWLDADSPDIHSCLIKFFDKVGSLTAPVIDAEKLIWDKVLQ